MTARDLDSVSVELHTRPVPWLLSGLLLFALLAMEMVACEKEENGRLEVSGTIEAEDVHVSSTVGGKIAEVLVREGEKIDKDQVVLRFDTKDIELQADQARAARRLASAQLRLARGGARKEDIAAARELVKQARVAKGAAAADLERAEELAPEGALTDKQLDDARSRFKVTESQFRAAKQQLRKALNGARPEELEMAEAGVAQAEAVVAIAEKKIQDCEVRAPMTGSIVHRLVEPGEIAGPGGTLLVMQDLSVLRLTVFVPEKELGRVRLGAPVKVSIDSHPGRSFPGRVSRIRENAEFTPRNVQTKDERVKLVFGVEVELENPDGLLKPGLPADAIIDEGPVTAGGEARP